MDRGRPGTKHHLLVDGQGTPLVALATAANVADVAMLDELVASVPPLSGGRRGRPRSRPRQLFADRAYDSAAHRRRLWKRGIRPRIARRGQAHGSGLGRLRWPVERSFSWLHSNMALRIRRDRTLASHQAMLDLACSLICFRKWKSVAFC